MSQVGKAKGPTPAAPEGFLSELGDFFTNMVHEVTDEVKSIAARVAPTLVQEGEAVAQYVLATAEQLGEMAMASVIAEADAINKTPTQKFADAASAVGQTLTVQGKTAASGLVNIAVESAYQTLKKVAETVQSDLTAATAKAGS